MGLGRENVLTNCWEALLVISSNGAKLNVYLFFTTSRDDMPREVGELAASYAIIGTH